MASSRRETLVQLAAFLVLALALRFFSFFPLAIDHDESTYLVIAAELLKEKVYWEDISDTKPPGIFLLCAGLIALVGNNVFMIRLLVALWIGFTAWGIARIAALWMPQGPGPWLAGVCWLFLTSVFTFYGVSPNTELFFAGTSVWALWLVLAFPWRWWAMIVAGLSLGMGIAVKQVAAFDALAFGIFLLAAILREPQRRLVRLTRLAGMTLMSMVPFAAIAWWYFDRGLGETWYFHHFELPGRYPEYSGTVDRLIYVMDFFLRFAPVTLLATLAFRHWRQPLGLLVLWMACGAVAILLPGNAFGHYTIQWMAPMALLAGLALDPASSLPRRLAFLRNKRLGWSLLALLMVLNMSFQARDYFYKPDQKKKALTLILAAEKERGNTGPPSLYTGDTPFQILYFALNTSPPVKYPHPSLIWEAEHRENMGHGLEELLKPVYRHPPDYVLFSTRHPDSQFQRFLDGKYTAIDTLQRQIILYRKHS